MITLSQITLIALTGLNYQTNESLVALEKSCRGIEWGAVKYIQQGDIKDIDSWNRAVIYDLPKYIETSHAMFIHGDGYVINPHLWRDVWLEYDYIGAPWPLPTDDYSYRSESGQIVRVGNSVSLRSKKLMNLVATREWRSYYGNTNEDGFINCHNREWLEEQGCRFPPIEEAAIFSKEHEIPENEGLETFAFHLL